MITFAVEGDAGCLRYLLIFLARKRGEYGKSHSASVTSAHILFTLAFGLEFALIAYRATSVPSIDSLPANAVAEDLRLFLANFYPTLVVEALLVFGVTAACGLAMVAMIRHLAAAGGRRSSAPFLVLSLAAPTLILLMAIQAPRLVGPVEGYGPGGLLDGLLAFANASFVIFVVYLIADLLSMLALAMYLMLLRTAKKGASRDPESERAQAFAAIEAQFARAPPT